MTSSPFYQLTLHKTYYEKGFFNLGVSVSRFVRQDSGPVTIVLGDSGKRVTGHVNREANTNGTPRIYGGSELMLWIQRNFELMDVARVFIENPKEIRISDSK